MGEKIIKESSSETEIPREFLRPGQLDEWNNRKYHIERYGNEYSVVIIGEKHGNPDFRAKQIELIRLIRPEFVLHEYLSGWIYNPRKQRFEKQKARNFNDLDDVEDRVPSQELISVANEVGFKIIGCDLNSAELTKYEKQLAKQFPDKYIYDVVGGFGELKKIDDPDYIFSAQSEEVIPFRDECMVQTILDYQKKSARPIVSIMGTRHGDNIHDGKMLQDKGFGYLYIDQTKIDG